MATDATRDPPEPATAGRVVKIWKVWLWSSKSQLPPAHGFDPLDGQRADRRWPLQAVPDRPVHAEPVDEVLHLGGDRRRPPVCWPPLFADARARLGLDHARGGAARRELHAAVPRVVEPGAARDLLRELAAQVIDPAEQVLAPPRAERDDRLLPVEPDLPVRRRELAHVALPLAQQVLLKP